MYSYLTLWTRLVNPCIYEFRTHLPFQFVVDKIFIEYFFIIHPVDNFFCLEQAPGNTIITFNCKGPIAVNQVI